MEDQERTERAEEEMDDVEAHVSSKKTVSASDSAGDELEDSDVEAHSLRKPPSNY